MDEIDSGIIEELRLDGRIGHGELANRLGVSRPTASKRLNALLDSGVIRVVGVAHPSMLGVNSVAHVSVDVDQPIRRVATAIASLAEVVFVSLTSGRYPLVAEIRAVDGDALARTLDAIRLVDGVRETDTLVYTDLLVDVLKSRKIPTVSIDRLDVELMKLLREDGRASYLALGEQTGVSAGTARTRVLRLVGEGVLRVGALSRPGTEERVIPVGIGVRLRGRASAVSDQLVDMPGLRFLATTLGRFDLIGTVHSADLSGTIDVVDRIRGLRSVLEIHSWVHVETVKELYHYAPVGGFGPTQAGRQ
nr:Lrp/AsnC family transcriptional regulator [uncultured Rhodococcus sp.]